MWQSFAVTVTDGVARALRDLPLGMHKLVPAEVRTALRHRMGRYYPYEPGFDFRAHPVPAPGEVTGAPDFVGIGVQKAGTTWWFRLLCDHPGAEHLLSRPRHGLYFGPILKERHFFGRFGAAPFTDTDVADYRAWFPRPPGVVTGEWTPDYLYYPWVPELVARAAPEARLLVMLRDPVQRFRSGLAGEYRNGAMHVGAAVAEALGHSLYAANLRRWFDTFDRSRIQVLQYEQCVADPGPHLEATYRFLGLDPGHRPEGMARPVHRTVEQKAGLDDDTTARLLEIFHPDLAALATLLPELDLSLWPSAAGVTGT